MYGKIWLINCVNEQENSKLVFLSRKKVLSLMRLTILGGEWNSSCFYLFHSFLEECGHIWGFKERHLLRLSWFDLFVPLLKVSSLVPSIIKMLMPYLLDGCLVSVRMTMKWALSLLVRLGWSSVYSQHSYVVWTAHGNRATRFMTRISATSKQHFQ